MQELDSKTLEPKGKNIRPTYNGSPVIWGPVTISPEQYHLEESDILLHLRISRILGTGVTSTQAILSLYYDGNRIIIPQKINFSISEEDYHKLIDEIETELSKL